MASVADSPAAVPAGAGTPPQSGSPVAAKRAATTAWKRPENGPVPVLMAPAIMDADSWPALPGLVSPQPPTPPKASPKAAPPPSTGAMISPVSLGDSGALDANSDHEALVDSPPARRASVFSEGDGLEIRAPGPEPSPVYSPNARSNGGGDHHHQNGRFGSHPHGRSGGYGGGNRRGNGGGGIRHGHEYHGGFDGPRRGGGRRDGHGPGHQQRGQQPSYIRAPPPLAVVAAPPPTPSFVGPAAPQTPPYGPPMSFPAEMAPHVYYFAVPPSDGLQALPFVPPPPTPPPAMLISPFEHLQRQLLVQIEYYFSDENLCKDIYLRQHMDDQGWVPISLIACFNQVKNFLYRIAQVRKLTNTLQFILDTVRQSLVVEVQGDKIRRRARWEIWLLPRSNYSAGNTSGSLSPVTSNIDSLVSQFQSVGLEGTAYHPNMQAMPSQAFLARSATSVSIGYQAPTFGGLHSNGSEPIFGQRTARSLLRSDTF
ncbi:la-related protein 1B isoform X1 [Brachypodium distachyon]|uniref:HTH La-type RNA-binding domain-containing protein n=1 Tax=Brachypodium distachyon TaxID=15368 RepID=A0A0Q3HKU2_BRADI|nr:la-related protein 1B isoform X1 [Brachypodium distachyon]KQK23575.1 hypothetical protein BRADI_1g74700v3 [Brachypodium distachyon]PNT78167.1 hypothetical protein BRADI_1g74700v3 [Brachypodium distachyon]|eukprot:XP_024311177.1 la-related protein 1B isoform X1 [Brachypodium distachyon]